MNLLDRLAKLEKHVQLAITEYISETDDQNCSVLISVRVKDGWTAVPEVKFYSNFYIGDNDTDNAEENHGDDSI